MPYWAAWRTLPRHQRPKAVWVLAIEIGRPVDMRTAAYGCLRLLVHLADAKEGKRHCAEHEAARNHHDHDLSKNVLAVGLASAPSSKHAMMAATVQSANALQHRSKAVRCCRMEFVSNLIPKTLSSSMKKARSMDSP